MRLDRIDLADIHHPTILAKAIHRQLGTIAPPVPVTKIARALDIAEVRTGTFDGFEGMLLTDRVRSTGAILANSCRGDRRARFTVAHELGHFLMERHVLSGERGFACQLRDMRETCEARQYVRQEAQANAFAIGLLAPGCMFDPFLSDDPDLRDAQRASRDLNISLEASVRRMVDRRPECLAAIWTRNGQVRYIHRSKDFPWINRNPKDAIAQSTMAFRAISNGTHGFTEFSDTHAFAWTDRPSLELHEQTRVGKDGHAVTLLRVIPHRDDDEHDDGPDELSVPRFR